MATASSRSSLRAISRDPLTILNSFRGGGYSIAPLDPPSIGHFYWAPLTHLALGKSIYATGSQSHSQSRSRDAPRWPKNWTDFYLLSTLFLNGDQFLNQLILCWLRFCLNTNICVGIRYTLDMQCRGHNQAKVKSYYTWHGHHLSSLLYSILLNTEFQ